MTGYVRGIPQNSVVVRSGDWSSPSQTVALWDPETTDAELLPRVEDALDAVGLASVAIILERPDVSTGFVGLRVSLAELGSDLDAFYAIGRQIGDLVRRVDPALAALVIEDAPEGLPEGEFDGTQRLWGTGYVRLRSLDDRQRLAFDSLRRRGMATEFAQGLVWSDGESPPLNGNWHEADPGAVIYAVFTAWTGKPAPDRPPPAEPFDKLAANPPQLWFWDPRRPVDHLETAVEQLLPDFAVWVSEHLPGWQHVVADPPEGLTDQDELLDHLRRVVKVVAPAWGALQPTRGFFIPGVDMEVVEMGDLDHFWVDDAWAGARLPEIESVLAPRGPERVGGGSLFVTYSDPRKGGPFWYSTAQEYVDYLRPATRVLGELAIAYLGPPWPGDSP